MSSPRIYQDPPASNQEAFDRVWRTFVTEKQPQAMESDACLYRTKDGRGCAIGCQLPDALYHPAFEGKASDFLFGFNDYCYTTFEGRDELTDKIAEHFKAVDANVLAELQKAHDTGYEPEQLEENLRKVALKFDLTIPEAA